MLSTIFYAFTVIQQAHSVQIGVEVPVGSEELGKVKVRLAYESRHSPAGSLLAPPVDVGHES